MDGDAKPQTEMIFKNIMAILNKANLDKKNNRKSIINRLVESLNSI